MKKITTIILAGLLLSTNTQANPKLLLATGLTTSVASAVIQYKALEFRTNLYEQAMQGDEVTSKKYQAFNKQMPPYMLKAYTRVTAQFGTTILGVATSSMGVASIPWKATSFISASPITKVFGGAAIGFTVYDYMQLQNAIKAANAVTAESIQADLNKKIILDSNK
jgi:hypothetical protein